MSKGRKTMKLIDADRFERVLMAMPDDELCEDCCYNVVNKLDEAPTIEAEPVARWISVKDRLPEKSGDVLVCSRGFCLPVPYSQRWKAFNASDYDDGTKHALNAVTHWMPLPEPPKEGD